MYKFIISSIFIFSLFSCSQNQETTANNRIDEKYRPNEEFSLQRTYPDKIFALSAFENGLKEAKAADLLKDIQGFDEEWTVQGPGNIGARVNTIAAHPTDENIIYVGFARGGVWKTADGGTTWNPIFDDQLFLSIGDIEIDPNNPNTIYVGTGDPNISGYPSFGDGIYKSTDAGATWTHIGLTDTRITSRILVDPSDPNKIYVGAMGIPFEPTNDKGLYRSVDGGETWEQSLFIADTVGVIDIVMNPNSPEILYASSWNRIRNNQQSSVHGTGAKIWKTTDSGANWTELGNGLPTGDLGRIGLTISPSNPDKIYAVYVGADSQLFGVYWTENSGDTWNELNTHGPFENYPDNEDLREFALGGFGWYFSKIRVNPFDENEIYIGGVELWKANITNGFAVWSQASPVWYSYDVHADKHDLVWDAAGNMLLATDGGVYKSSNQGTDWEDIENIPTSQFYRVAYNPHEPNNYFGGMQDNGTSGGNANNINSWPRIFGGDGFQPAFHPTDDQVFYVETQKGRIRRTDNGGFQFETILSGIDADDRRAWDMPYILSHHDPEILYTGTFRAYKGIFTDNNGGWVDISLDLTDGNIFGTAFHTISALDESHFEEGLLYYGTSDGNAHRINSINGAAANISTDLPDRYITSIKTSPEFENTVYISHSGYKDNEFIPRLHRSDDKGENWIDISGDLPNLAVNSIFVLPNHQDSIIFIANDGGVYGTINSGQNWERLGNNMPMIPVYDLKHNISNNEVIAGTFARSIMTYPIDSILVMEIEEPDTMLIAVDGAQKIYNTLKIFPSPASDYIQLEFSQNEAGKEYELVILNKKGKVMLHQKKQQEGKVSEQINVNYLSSGQYFVKIKYRHTILTGSFVKI